MTQDAPEYLDLLPDGGDGGGGCVTTVFREEVAGLLGPGGLISEPAQLRTYEYDGLTGQDICRRNATTHLRIARDLVERAKVWKGSGRRGPNC